MSPPTIPDPVRAAACARPDAPALIAPERVVTYADLHWRVAATARRLAEYGLAPGERFAVYRLPDADALVAVLAALRVRAVVCPVSARLPVAAVPGLLDPLGISVIATASDGMGDEASVLRLDTSADGSDGEGPAPWGLTDPATLVFTSGSTGVPKAALHSVGSHVASARGSVAFLGLRPGDRWLLTLPLYHVGGLAVLFRCVLAGAAVVLPDEGVPIEQAVSEHGVTHTSLVATQLLRVLRGGRPEALGRMQAVLLGGSAVPPGLVAEAHALGLPIHTSYGLTEMASTVAATPPGASLDALSTSGVVLPDRAVRLADDGEILVRGATLFEGYVEGETVALPTGAGGWFPTGDLGAWAETDGGRMLRVVGRKDHLFISGGENVQPEEIEAALGRINGVRRSVVVPVGDDEFGQRPLAFVDAEEWTPEAWREALSAVLPRFKIPDAFHPWPDDAPPG